MTWQAIGAIAEVTGALAVVITLVYLALQLREHTKSLRIQSLESSFHDRNQLLIELRDPNGVGDYLRKANAGESLSDNEAHELSNWLLRVMNVNEKVHYLHSIHAVDNFNYHVFKRNLPRLTNSDYFVSWWRDNRGRYSELFQDFMDDYLSK